MFLVDVSMNSHSVGLFQQVVQSIRAAIDYIPNPENSDIAIITFDVTVHYYVMPEDPKNDPSILIQSEVNDPFAPFPREKLLLNLHKDAEKISLLLEKLPTMQTVDTAKTLPNGLCLGAAVSSARELLSQSGGRIMVFFSKIPSLGLGTLTVRENHKLYNTEKEKILLNPESNDLLRLSRECN